MPAQPESINEWAAFAVACISCLGFIAGVGAFVQGVKSHGRRLKALEKAVAIIPEDIRQRLYNADSQPIYVPAARCKELQTSCSEGLEKRMSAMDSKLDMLINLHMKEGEY